MKKYIRPLTIQPCARCNKTMYQIAKITLYGPVCNSCAPYFREKKACGVCGQLTSRLSRVSRLGILVPVCQKCARRDYGTCAVCRRYRRLVQSKNGLSVCILCSEQKERVCSVCGVNIPAGLGEKCLSCSLSCTLQKRVAINTSAFAKGAIRDAYVDFCIWLPSAVGLKKAVLKVNVYLAFFLEIENAFNQIPDYLSMLKYFGSQRLRWAIVPMRWMESTGRLVVDVAAREEDTLYRRISILLKKIPSESYEKKLLDAYHKEMLIRFNSGAIKLRSIYFSLYSAVSFLQKSLELKCGLSNQTALDLYLNEKPGQFNSLSVFINFLNTKQDIHLSLVKRSSNIDKGRKIKQIEKEIIQMMVNPLKYKNFQKKWISSGLLYFHKLPSSVKISIPKANIKLQEDGIVVVWHKMQYWLPVIDEMRVYFTNGEESECRRK